MISQAKNLIKKHIGGKTKVTLMNSYVFAKNLSLDNRVFHQKEKKLFVILPTIDRSFMQQRVHHIARAMKEDYDTIFMSSRKKTDKFSGFVYEDGVWLCSSIFLINKLIKQNNYEEIIFYTTEINNLFLLKFIKGFELNAAIRPKKFKLVYDIVDELQVQAYYIPSLEDYHELIVRRSDLVIASSEKLYLQAKKIRKDVVLFENGVWWQDWQKKEHIPEQLEKIKQDGKPIIGFYGAIFEWLDYDLLEYCIQNSDYNYVFIGPIFDARFSRLKNLINCYHIDRQPYSQLNSFLQYFDVALWPFVIDEVTKSVSPVKVYEYMAGGKVVVASDLPFARKNSQYLMIGRNPQEFLQKINLALQVKDDEKLIEKIKNHAKKYSWSKIVEIFEKL